MWWERENKHEFMGLPPFAKGGPEGRASLLSLITIAFMVLIVIIVMTIITIIISTPPEVLPSNSDEAKARAAAQLNNALHRRVQAVLARRRGRSDMP